MAEYQRLDEICYINMGQSPDSKSYNEDGSGLPFFQGNADFGIMYPTAKVWCCKPIKVVDPDTLLISVRAPIGALNFSQERSCIGRGLAGITAKNGVNLKYVYYCLRSKSSELNSKGTGSTFKAITKNALGEIAVRIRNESEQLRIVRILDGVSDLITSHKQQVNKLDDLIKARFVEMFGDPETNPLGWERVRVADVCSSIVRGPFGSALKKDFFVEPDETTYKVYEQKHAIQKSATIGTYYITEEKYKELKRFECVAGDILMSCSGTMGELYQLPVDCERGIINQALCKFTLNTRILPIVFLMYMKQTIGNLETKGSGIQNIAAVSYVKAMPINLPPLGFQQKFADFVAQVDKSRFAVQKALDETKVLFDSLMQEYFG